MNVAKNQHKSFKSAMISDDSFMTVSEGLIAMEEIDFVEYYPLLECTATSEEQTLHTMNARQSNFRCIRHLRRGISSAGMDEEAQHSQGH